MKNFMIFIFLITALSCQKENQASVDTDAIEFSKYQHLLGTIVDFNLVSNDKIDEAYKLSIRGRSEDKDKVMNLLKIDKSKYESYLIAMYNIKLKHKQQFNLTDSQNDDYFTKVPQTNVIDPGCVIKAWSVFAATSIGCIALGAGSFGILQGPCTIFAISILTCSLRDCARDAAALPK